MIGELRGTTRRGCRLNDRALRDVNPVCYRHRLPAISGSLFKILAAGLGGASSGIWPASSWHGRHDSNNDDDDNDDNVLRALRAVTWLCQDHRPMVVVE